jgi:hypothetical protein
MIFKFIKFITLLTLTTSTILTDNGCSCALTKTTTTTPSAGGTINVGCSLKNDWTNTTSKWCLADQTYGTCGTLQNGFGWVDSCSIANINATVANPNYIEWDQTGNTFYTGQNININWTSTNIDNKELLKITYLGTSLRTLTTGSGVNITSNSFGLRLSDSANGLATNVPITVSSTSPTIISNTQNITILQSKLINLNVYDSTNILTTTSTIPCDGRNLSIMWRGLGQAQFGTVTISIKSGGGTTVGTSVTGISTSNNTFLYTLPRSFTPNTFSTYSAQISVQDFVPGSAPYTGTSVSFKLSVPSSPSPTSSITSTSTGTPFTTQSNTPTPSTTISVTPSNTPTVSNTPSSTPTISNTPQSATQTPTQTPTISFSSSNTPTPTTTETARPSVDLDAIAKAAAASNAPIIGGVLGIVLMIIIGIVGYMLYQRKLLRDKRMRKLRVSNRTLRDRSIVYGVNDESETENRSQVIMYQVTTGEMNNKKINNLKQYNHRK